MFKKVVPTDADLVASVEAHLKRTADAVSYMLPKEKFDFDFGDAFTGEDDSVDEGD